MRIISPFRDYYDGVQALGQDQDLHYLRRSEELPLQGPGADALVAAAPALPHPGHPHQLYCAMERGVLGVGGALYPLLRVLLHSTLRQEAAETTVYSAEELFDFLAKSRRDELRSVLMSDKPRRRGTPSARKGLEAYFDPASWPQERLQELFVQHRTPLYWLRLRRHRRADTWQWAFDVRALLTLHPHLQPLGFGRCQDAPTLFQNVAQFLSGVLGAGEPETVQVDDASLAAKKGFDQKSFRTAPGGKKRRAKDA